MSDEPSFLTDPTGTREQIMRATYLALREHGYADLTIKRIGGEFEKSVSLLYQHYDGKDELLLEFLSFMLDEFQRSLPPLSADDPATHLDAVLDHAFAPDPPTECREFEATMVELRAQAASDERYRERFTDHDRFFRDRLARVLRAGIEDGTFREVDPEAVAAFLFAAV
ncbi:TetR/AcrR family transcriptional regulator, partial [Halobium palmae]